MKNLGLGGGKKKSTGEPAAPAEYCPDAYTRSLIGDDTYDRMVKTVDNIWKKHKTDQCISVAITAGPNSREAEQELHHLLPGQQLQLHRLVQSSMDCVDVYSNGYRVGRLLLGDAESVIRIMKTSSITGAYVAEQNCFGDCSHLSLRIIVFHAPARRAVPELSSQKESPYKITYDGTQQITIYQN